jgi:Na+-translocating ferredoxin:NAD+ oxidoreductase subunit B
MHTVLAERCTGCELCIAPCPVDCIEMHPAPEPLPEAQLNRARYAEHTLRIDQRAAERQRELAAKKAGARRNLPAGP